MRGASVGELIDQWMMIYEDHQSMVEEPERCWHLLNELIINMYATEEVDEALCSEFVSKSAAAYQWALEFKAAQSLLDDRSSTDMAKQAVFAEPP